MTENGIRSTEKLKRKILRLSALVEEQARRCVLSVRTRDRQAAQHVIDADAEIDALEISIEKDCIAMLETGGPAYVDIRFAIGVLKINVDLERIGDLAANIGRSVLSLGRHEQLVLPGELTQMSERMVRMLTATLDALVHMDTEGAREVCGMDADVDTLNRAMYAVVRDRIQENPAQTERLLHLLGISRAMERIADYATNIAENVVFMQEGIIIRHGGEPPTPDNAESR
ncbi:MAG: phosphate signaling complex protein PhoU [Bacteroidota bacterium]|nr:phosphate signaling complex protein PhoU [Bacteroidota bacterium]